MKQPEVRMEEAGTFLTEYTSLLWGCGATCVRIEKNVRRIASGYGYKAELTILPGHLSIILSPEAGGEERLFTSIIHPRCIDFSLNADLSALSWSISDNMLPPDEARSRLRKLLAKPHSQSMRIAMLASLANASFCRLFSGDALAMAVVFAATLIGYILKSHLLERKVDNRIVVFTCAMVSSLLCAGATIFSWGTTPHVAQATSVLYLIPGVPYINAASDLMTRHYLCAVSRATDAAVLTAALSAGLYLGVNIMNINML